MNKQPLFLRPFLWFWQLAMNQAHLTIFLFVLIFVTAGYGLKYSRLQLDIYDVYDTNFQSSVDLFEMKDLYQDQSQILVTFSFPNRPVALEICRLLEWSRTVQNQKDVKGISSFWTIRRPESKQDKLWYPKVLSNPCAENPDAVIPLEAKMSQDFFRHMLSQTGGKDLVFEVAFSDGTSDMNLIQKLMDETELYTKKQLPHVEVKYLGLASFRYYFKKIMAKDSLISLIILLIILLVMRWVYGSWRGGVYLGFILLFLTVILYGSMAWLGIPIDILTNNLFLMTAVAGTADFIFVTQFQLKGSYQDSFKKLLVPCFFTTLTTIVGFLSLNTSDLGIIRRFGSGAALGAMLEWLVMFLFLPALLKVLNQEKKWINLDKKMKSTWTSKLQNLKLPQFVVRGLIVLMVLALPSFFFMNDQDSPVKNLPEEHVLRKTYEDFKQKFLWEGQVYLYFPRLISNEEKKNIFDKLQKNPLIYRIENPDEMVEQWTQGQDPLRKDLIARELSMTPLWEKYYSSGETLRVPLYLTEQDLGSLRKLRNDVQAACADNCRLAGQRVVYLEYGEKISKTMIESFAMSLLLVITLLSWLLWINGKIKYLRAVILSALIGPLVTLTLMVVLQIPVTLITSIFLAVMVGLAGDNAIQYLLAEEADLAHAIDSRAEASLIVTLIMMLGSGMFLFQSLLPMKILGGLFLCGFFINLVGDLWGLKGLLPKD